MPISNDDAAEIVIRLGVMAEGGVLSFNAAASAVWQQTENEGRDIPIAVDKKAS